MNACPDMRPEILDSETPKTSKKPENVTIPKNSPENKVAGKQVLLVINSDAGGGVEHIASILAADLKKQGASVKTIFLYPASDASRQEKLGGIIKTMKQIIRIRPDMLITFQGTSSIVACFTGRFSGCRARIVHQCNMPELTHIIPRSLDYMAGILGFYSANIMISEVTEEAFSLYPKPYRSHLKSIHHGLECAPAKRDRAAVRKSLDIGDNTPVLLTCARLSREKSLDTVITALQDIPGAVFVIAGDGALRQELEDLARNLGVLEQVRFTGFISRDVLFDLHGAADLFVFPSRTETYGMAVIEAAMNGLPVVASTIPMTQKGLVIDGMTPAILVEDWSAKKWAETLKEAVSSQKLTRQAARFAPVISRFYGMETMLKKYHKLYREVL